MAAPQDTFALEEIITRNRIDVRWFLPFVIYRLQPLSTKRTAILNVELRDILEVPSATRQLHLTWEAASEELSVPPVQEHIVTEWAACGIACAVVPLYTHFQVLQVTQSGDGFDYWIGNNIQEFGLEISGTLAGDIEQRHREKVRQAFNSPQTLRAILA